MKLVYDKGGSEKEIETNKIKKLLFKYLKYKLIESSKKMKINISFLPIASSSAIGNIISLLFYLLKKLEK